MYSEIKNNIDFFIRNITGFSRKNFEERNLNLIHINKKENQYIYDLMNRFFNSNFKKNLKALDVGCKNWYYIEAQHNFYKNISENFKLDGVEIDPHRLYSNLYSRYEVAKHYMKKFKNSNYIKGNLLDINEKYDYITWFLPFVSIEPLKNWGLPKKFFNPQKLLEHAYSILNNNGEMLIINQGKKESQIQKTLLQELAIAYIDLGIIESKYFNYKHERYGFLIKK